MADCGTCKHYDYKEICENCHSNNVLYEPVYRAENVVEIVRCKDCVYFSYTCSDIHGLGTCELMPEDGWNEFDFCSYGKRKELPEEK